MPKVCVCCAFASAGSKNRSGYATVGSDLYANENDDDSDDGAADLDGSDLETIRKLSLYRDELEKEEVRKWRKRIKGQSESDTEEESDYGESVDYTDNPLLMEKGKSESEMRDADGDGIEMMDNPMLTNPMMAQL